MTTTHTKPLMATLVSLLLFLCCCVAPSTAVANDDFSGLWFGTLRAGLKELRMVIRVELTENGRRAFFTNLDRDNVEHPAEVVTIEAREIRVELAKPKAVFEGRLDDTGQRIEGMYTQKEVSLPLVLERTDRVPELPRPQNPTPPFPYTQEEVAFENPDADVRLAGTLTLPDRPGPHPVALLISGSGPQDRDETVFGHRPFLVIADYLTRRGLAVLRVDDRGVGQSTGTREGVTSEDFVGDALAGVAYLKSRPDIDPARIGLIGHSEGGLIAPMAAVRAPEIAFIVLLGAPGVSGMELSLLQGQAMLAAAGASKDHLEFNYALQSRVLQALIEEPDEASMRARADVVVTEELTRAGFGEGPQMDAARAAVEPQIQRALTPWFRFFLAHDPAETLARVSCPVLALSGDRDTQTPAEENLRAIESALRQGGNADHQVVALPGLNHLFQPSETGALSEYAKIEITFAPEALAVLGDWLTARARL